MSDTARTAAHRLAIRFEDLLTEAFRGKSYATTYDINGAIYVVTSGTGEGQDYAYKVPSSEDLDALQVEIESGTWSYSSWCLESPDYTADRDDAVAYYLATGRMLGAGGSTILDGTCTMDEARANVDCCHEMGGIS